MLECVKKYTTMHYFEIPWHTQPMTVFKICLSIPGNFGQKQGKICPFAFMLNTL